jgi:soluble lytic murein transglycosylase-like protein
MTMQPACPRIIRLKHPPRHSPFSFSAILNFGYCRVARSRARAVRRALCIAATVALMAGNTVHAEPVSNGGAQVSSDPLAATVAEAAQRSGIPASWIRAVMQAESGGDARAVSPKGAMGLMQIMPETWATLRLRYGLGADPFDAHDNIVAGATYLRELHDRYGSPGFLAAYNAGPARYEDHLATGQPLPAETRAYVALLAPLIGTGAIDETAMVAVAARSWTEAPLFTVRADGQTAADQRTAEQHADHQSTHTGAQDLTALAPQSEGLFVLTSRRNQRP